MRERGTLSGEKEKGHLYGKAQNEEFFQGIYPRFDIYDLSDISSKT